MMRAWVAAAAIAVVVAGCSNIKGSDVPVALAPDTPATTKPAPADGDASGGRGLAAKPASTAFPMEARDIRLVRLDQQDIALQFELFNGTQETVEPYDIGMGLIERDFKLVDVPRATSYDVQQSTGFDGRVSDNQYEEIAPGSTATITAVFTAPPQDTTKLWFMTNVLQPVEIPVQPAGSAALEGRPRAHGPAGRQVVRRCAGVHEQGRRSRGRRNAGGDQAAQRRAVRVRQIGPHTCRGSRARRRRGPDSGRPRARSRSRDTPTPSATICPIRCCRRRERHRCGLHCRKGSAADSPWTQSDSVSPARWRRTRTRTAVTIPTAALRTAGSRSAPAT